MARYWPKGASRSEKRTIRAALRYTRAKDRAERLRRSGVALLKEWRYEPSEKVIRDFLLKNLGEQKPQDARPSDG
jgi:hypothetical protein